MRMDNRVRPAWRDDDAAMGVDETKLVNNDIADLGFASRYLARELLHPTEKPLFFAVQKELRCVIARIEILDQPRFRVGAYQEMGAIGPYAFDLRVMVIGRPQPTPRYSVDARAFCLLAHVTRPRSWFPAPEYMAPRRTAENC